MQRADIIEMNHTRRGIIKLPTTKVKVEHTIHDKNIRSIARIQTQAKNPITTCTSLWKDTRLA